MKSIQEKCATDDKIMGMEKLSMNRKNDIGDTKKDTFEYFSGVATPKKKNSRKQQINYPMTPPPRVSVDRFCVSTLSTISPTSIDRSYRRLIKFMSSPSSTRSTSPYVSPFCSPTTEDISKKTRHYHKSPKEGRSSPYRSKSDPAILFPTDLNSPSKKHLYSDRHIPSRTASLLGDGAFVDTHEDKKNNNNAPDGTDNTYSLLLRNAVLGPGSGNQCSIGHRTSKTPGPIGQKCGGKGYFTRSHRRTFRFKSPKRPSPLESPFSVSPVGVDSERLLSSPRKAPRKIPKSAFKVLDAPSLKDDFYLNLVDWSYANVLAVGLASCVYLWSACTSKVTKLCDLGEDGPVTSVTWNQRGTDLAIGTHTGEVQIWNTSKCKLVNTMKGHVARVGTLAWSSHLLASGSRDRMIFLRDPRSSRDWETKLSQGHKQEVCGLKWSFDDQQLASGGNDNKLLIWSARNSHLPIIRCRDHKAAVKAIAWSPHQSGLLASGGGTADRCIRFRNTLTDTVLNTVDTGSQVCNLIWSKNVNEIVTTHGYSLNQIIVWKYPSMTPLATLTGHTFRVLYLAISPDGQTIVTGAGDETLRFWNVFPMSKSKSNSSLNSNLSFLSSSNIR